jgi:tRNA pseudouridine38-40 synthase
LRRVRLVVEYDGAGFCGFQKQHSQTTIQGALERGLEQVYGHPVEVVGAGRTDAGVHALGQVVHFDTTGRIPTERISMVVNAGLSPDVRVRAAEETEPEFHARFSAAQRSYDYFFCREAEPGPFLGRWVVAERLLLPDAAERMRSAVAALLGRKDFAAFCGTGSTNHTTIREVFLAEIAERGSLIRFRITANAFLKSMVRILAGTLLEIGAGRREPEAMETALRSGDRGKAGITAPPQGLFLMRVDYPDGYPGSDARATLPFWLDD